MRIVAKEAMTKLTEQPVDIAGPAEMFGLKVQMKSLIGKERLARLGGALVVAVDRDDDREILERLILDRMQRVGDKSDPR
jgi:hypothetical protein